MRTGGPSAPCGAPHAGTASRRPRRAAPRQPGSPLGAQRNHGRDADIPELSRFEITPAITDAIEDAGGCLASASGLAPGAKVGLMGISFSGGLSAIAAGRPSMTDRVAFVFAFGGHDDLPRVLRYLCTGVEPRPGGLRRTADAATGAVTLLWASHLDRVDKPPADREFAAVRDEATRLPEPAGTLLRYVSARDVAHLGRTLLPFVGFYGGDPSLSASKSPKPSAPVFLLHGLGDNVIPAIESEYLAETLRGHAPVRLLLSGLISHAEADQPMRLGDVLQLASFWGDLLSR